MNQDGVAAIAAGPYANLTHLDLWGTKFGESGAAALIESSGLESIRYLNIGDTKLKPATVKALQKRYPRAIAKKRYG